MEYYLLIKCGYEGIEQLIMPSSEPNILVNKINDIRNNIKILREKRKNLLKENNQDEDCEELHDVWDNLYQDEKLTSEEWELGKWGKVESYCIQKWNGEHFECCCKELNVNIGNKLWLY